MIMMRDAGEGLLYLLFLIKLIIYCIRHRNRITLGLRQYARSPPTNLNNFTACKRPYKYYF